jgi:hypothetical protein
MSASTALGSPPTVTLSGSAHDGSGPSPDGDHDRVVEVDATLRGGVASGSVDTEGKEGNTGGPWDGFESQEVTCMVVSGDRVTVGAVGSAWHLGVGPGAEKEHLPEPYTQVLTVTFGKFQILEQPEPPFTAEFEMLGKDDQGVPSGSPPDCAAESSAGREHVASASTLHISPSITSPVDGSVSETGTVTLSGTAEPNTSVAVYEVGQAAGGTVVVADANGNWSATLTGVPVGKHVFSAFSDVTTIPANTVEIEVAAPLTNPESVPSANTPKPTGGLTAILGASRGDASLNVIGPVSTQVAVAGSILTRPGGALVPLRCTSTIGNCLPVTLELLVTERLYNGRVIAVTARRMSKLKQHTMVIGCSAVTLSAGKSEVVKVPLNSTGRELIAHHMKIAALLRILSQGKALENHAISIIQPNDRVRTRRR